jgi:tricarballylate dehydrogenase
VLAAGGFEASREMRARYLGPEWARAYVRGTPLNTGEMLEEAIAAGAAAHGDWSSCHSVAWDASADPAGGDRLFTNQHTRDGYPLGIVVNALGERFLDEGADYRNYTYARYGAEILTKAGGRAFQLFDAKVRPLLRPQQYDTDRTTVARAGSVVDLARAVGIDPVRLTGTVEAFNAAVRRDVPYDPAVKDGRRTVGIVPPKSNWAQPLDEAPFYAYPVTCGITFTFGGLRIDAAARVLTRYGDPIPGLYCAGEMVGGLFAGNYPGGAGLTAGAVFGRRAGGHAASQLRAGAPGAREGPRGVGRPEPESAR